MVLYAHDSGCAPINEKASRVHIRLRGPTSPMPAHGPRVRTNLGAAAELYLSVPLCMPPTTVLIVSFSLSTGHGRQVDGTIVD